MQPASFTVAWTIAALIAMHYGGDASRSGPALCCQDEHHFVDTNPFNPDGMDEAPPPPYESVVMDTAVQGVSGVGQSLNVMRSACLGMQQPLLL